MTYYGFPGSGGLTVTTNQTHWTDEQLSSKCVHLDGSVDYTRANHDYKCTSSAVDENRQDVTNHCLTCCVSLWDDARSRTDDKTGFTTNFLADQTQSDDVQVEQHNQWEASNGQGSWTDMTCHSWGTSGRHEQANLGGGVVREDDDHQSKCDFTHDEWATGVGYTHHSEDHNTTHTWLHDAANVTGLAWVLEAGDVPDTMLTQHGWGEVDVTRHNDVLNGWATSSGHDTCISDVRARGR